MRLFLINKTNLNMRAKLYTLLQVLFFACQKSEFLLQQSAVATPNSI